MVSQKSKIKQHKFNSKFKSIVTFNFLLTILTFNFLLLNSAIANAATVSNDNFQLELEPFEPVEEEEPLAPQNPQPAQSGSPGIAYIPSEFSFAMSNSLIDFGVISATSPVSRSTTLSIISPTSGYQVFGFENHNLRSKSSASIPDTTCDNGSCSEVTASVWENNLTYGFGFRCDSQRQSLCTTGFEDKKAFKQFTDLTKREAIQPILQSTSQTTMHEAQITYKVNISGTQQKAAYNNTVTYIAVPNF